MMNNLKVHFMRKGYVLVKLFSLFIAVTQSLKYRFFTKRDLGEETINNLVIQIVVLFLLFLIPGVLAVRWYYKQKDNRH